MRNFGIKGIGAALLTAMVLFAYPVLSTIGASQLGGAAVSIDTGPGLDFAPPSDSYAVTAFAAEFLTPNDTLTPSPMTFSVVHAPLARAGRSTVTAPDGVSTYSIVAANHAERIFRSST